MQRLAHCGALADIGQRSGHSAGPGVSLSLEDAHPEGAHVICVSNFGPLPRLQLTSGA